MQVFTLFRPPNTEIKIPKVQDHILLRAEIIISGYMLRKTVRTFEVHVRHFCDVNINVDSLTLFYSSFCSSDSTFRWTFF